jgi:hypothetical protein
MPRGAVGYQSGRPVRFQDEADFAGCLSYNREHAGCAGRVAVGDDPGRIMQGLLRHVAAAAALSALLLGPRQIQRIRMRFVTGR